MLVPSSPPEAPESGAVTPCEVPVAGGQAAAVHPRPNQTGARGHQADGVICERGGRYGGGGGPEGPGGGAEGAPRQARAPQGAPGRRYLPRKRRGPQPQRSGRARRGWRRWRRWGGFQPAGRRGGDVDGGVPDADGHRCRATFPLPFSHISSPLLPQTSAQAPCPDTSEGRAADRPQ